MKEFNPEKIGNTIKKGIQDYTLTPKIKETGRVLRVGDGIVKVDGLSRVVSGELLKFEGDATGIAMNLEEDEIGVVLLGDDREVKQGDLVQGTGRIASVPTGDNLLGRVVNPLGQPLDGLGKILTSTFGPIERIAPGVIDRGPVNEPLQTGIKAIDAMVPIGKGQRQLIIGDRQTGKTSIAVDTILNQKGKDINCIYVAIGQKTSTVADIVNTLNDYGAMSYTCVVSATAADPVSYLYLAPYTGCAIGEEWMSKGKDVLIVFDDLSKHAVAYRTMSLLLRRPPGREAYPGDVFYLHSRLLERAGKLSKELGGGSMTALPIIETQGGDMSAYIPTNVISITDGQIYLQTDLFNAGVRPAINPGLSVSRVGGSAQVPAMKKTAAPIRTELAQYRELEAFSQFSSDLSTDTIRQLEHGKRIVEVLKQGRHKMLQVEDEIIVLYATTKEYFNKVGIGNIVDCEEQMLEFINSWHPEIVNELKEEKKISKEQEKILRAALEEFITIYIKENEENEN